MHNRAYAYFQIVFYGLDGFDTFVWETYIHYVDLLEILIDLDGIFMIC